jgi:hypothetical protein
MVIFNELLDPRGPEEREAAMRAAIEGSEEIGLLTVCPDCRDAKKGIVAGGASQKTIQYADYAVCNSCLVGLKNRHGAREEASVKIADAVREILKAVVGFE